jgi:hypothetical protein
MKRSFRFLVQLADEFGFDFGGDGVASFAAQGDAVLFAQELRRRSDRSARVLDCFARVSVEVFCARGSITEAAEAARMAF